MKKITLLMLSCLLAVGVRAQVIYNSSGKQGEAKYARNKPKKGFDPNRLIFGGGVSAGMGDGMLALGVSPIAGYRFSDRLSAGLRLGYQYYWIKDGQELWYGTTGQTVLKNLNYHIISPGVWGRFIVWKSIFLMGEYEHNFFTSKEFFTTQTGVGSKRVFDNAPSLLLGAGIRQPVSDNASFVLMAFYDVLQNIPANQRTDAYGNTYSISPYAGQIGFRIGFNLGF
jgi:hypothetical protein